MQCEVWLCVLVASSRENESFHALQDEFPVDHPKDSSHFFNVFGFLWDNKVVAWVERELGKKGTSRLALPMHEWLYTQDLIFKLCEYVYCYLHFSSGGPNE